MRAGGVKTSMDMIGLSLGVAGMERVGLLHFQEGKAGYPGYSMQIQFMVSGGCYSG